MSLSIIESFIIIPIKDMAPKIAKIKIYIGFSPLITAHIMLASPVAIARKSKNIFLYFSFKNSNSFSSLVFYTHSFYGFAIYPAIALAAAIAEFAK